VAPIQVSQAPSSSDVPIPLTNLSPPAPLSKPRSSSTKGPILLFVGPPDTGKTSLGQSIARALGRPFQHISLGGVRDEAEIRGFRCTYVASGLGLIVQALSCVDPVILLDEVDKIEQSNFYGDSSTALLEALGPEQNWTMIIISMFQLIYLKFYLYSTLSSSLLNRCEIVNLAGYTFDEKVAIANRFLVPKQIGMNGLQKQYVEISEETLRDRYRVDKRDWGEEFGESYCRGSKLYSRPNGRRSMRAMGMFLRQENSNHRQHRQQPCYTIQLSAPLI